MIRVSNVNFERDRKILNNINFTVKKGEVFGIVGPSGAGKSTLLAIIGGLLDATSGNVKLEKEIIYGPKDRLIPGHPEIQIVNQEFGLDLYHTVKENLSVKANHLTIAIKQEFIEELLQLLELKSVENQQAITLSGGEKQRLALARALIMESKVILLDEPFAHMDAHIKRKVINYLIALKKTRKTSFIFVTHEGLDVLTLADRIAYFNYGEINRIDNPLNFFENPTNYQEGLFFGELNEIKLGNKTYLIRPNTISTHNFHNAIEITVKFSHAIYAGGFYQNYFQFKKNKTIIFYHNEILKDANKIYIKKN